MPIVVEFNPWMVSNTGALVEVLIGQIAVSIGKNFSEGKKGIAASRKLLSYVGLLKNLKYVPGLSWAGNVIEDFPGLMQTVATFSEQGTDAGRIALGDFEKLLPSWDISKKRDEVAEALGELDCPIVIVIDDIDRLPAEEIRAMIQAIKAVADFPRTTYLLAYDRNVVAQALAADEKSGLSYLEKIVQVAYPIPPLSQQKLKQFSNDKVQALLNALNISLRDYESERYEKALSLLTILARHPRDVVRVINRLTLSLPMTHGEVNAADVIVFEALSQRLPELREAIRNHSADFIGQPFRDDQIEEEGFDWGDYLKDRNEDKTEQPWLKHLPEDKHDRRISEKACLFLFTPQEKGGYRVTCEDYLGIADPDRLARLFRMTSIEEVPEAKEIHALLQNPVKLEDALLEDEQLLFLLEWMINYTPSCTAPDVGECIEKLIKTSLDLTSQCRLTDNSADKFATLMERLLRHKLSGYIDYFLNIAQNAPLSIAEMIVRSAAAEIGKWGNSDRHKESEDRQLISDGSIVDQAIQAWIKRVQKSVDQGYLYKEANLFSILYRFAQFNNDTYEDSYEAISRMCKTKEGLGAFLKYFEKESHSLSDRLALVADTEKLAQQIINSTLKEEYHWLVELLRREETIQFIQEHVAKHKSKAKP